MVASELFGDEERAAIAKAVAEAEKRTSGEIVPVVATASENYERTEGLAGIAVALGALAATWLLWQQVVPATGDYEAGHEPRLGVLFFLGVVAGGYVAGALGARAVPFLKRLLAGPGRMRTEVTRAAAAAFDRFHVRGTKGATGIVIYVSLFERMVCVLGDAPISEKVAEAEWQGVADLVVRGIREGRHAEGLAAAIAKCGEMLAAHFPIQAGDVNELSNELRLVD